MAFGKAVIITESLGVVEYVKDGYNCLVVRAGDVEGLSQAISYLLENPHEILKLGENARRTIETEFSVDRFVERMENLIQKLTLSRSIDRTERTT